MKKQANPKAVQFPKVPPETGASTPTQEAREPSGLTLWVPESPASAFDPLPEDSAPTRPAPEVKPAVLVPESRQPNISSGEGSAPAVPIPELNPGKTAPIPTKLLPDTHSQSANAVPGTSSMAKSTPALAPATPKNPPRGSWKMRLGVVILALHLITGAAIWYLWPKFRPQPEEARSAATLDSVPAAPEAVPSELRSYLEQAKGGDAKAMHLLALMYWNGLNVQQDRVKGLDWYRKSAAAGDKAAQKELSVIDQQ